jgi:Family of unknown function (DUF5946)
MRSAEEHAARHGLQLSTQGPCPMCGAPSGSGFDGCLTHAGRLGELVDFADEQHHVTRFLSVDAMALQHSEVHGPWNNYLHLARLRLILVDGLRWRYPYTPVLSAATDAYARGRRPELPPPPPGRRGALTALDLPGPAGADAAPAFVREWAGTVLQAYGPAALDAVRPISEDFRRRLDGGPRRRA